MLKVGDKVKDFSLEDANGNVHKLSNHLGKKVVIYFYPKDSTPGCTRQACGFRDNYEEIKNKDVILYGISADSKNSHMKFQNKHNLPFVLLSDPKSEIINYFGALQEKHLFGRTYLGIVRSTFIIDEKGYLEKVWMPASSGKNPKEVVDYLNDVK